MVDVDEAGEAADALVPAAGGVVTLAGAPARLAAAVTTAVGRSSEDSSGESIVVYGGDADVAT